MQAALWVVVIGAAAQAGDPPTTPDLLRTGSRAPFVHRISLYDEEGAAINPFDKNAPPYSSRATCGKCHEVGLIGHGWHFNAADPQAPKGRPGEPWVYVDAATGTQLPLSYRQWPGSWSPKHVGLTAWDFARRFGRHLPGGGVVFPPEVSDPPGLSRWPLSGGLDIDCLLCHGADQHHDPAERAKQIERENFRWIPTVAAGLAVVRGDVSKLPDDFDPALGPSPDYPERRMPRLEYDKSRFDSDHRVLLNITRRPSSDRCYYCHSSRRVDAPQPSPPWPDDQDVHLSAGMICVDCHRNGIDHKIVRGYEEELRGQDHSFGLSCRGCHLGLEAGSASAVSPAGRLGAPIPKHAGLPPLHLERIACTTCHSGPRPNMQAARLQTSLNHALGVPTRTRKDDDPPAIYGPVFLRDENGVITPYREIWPAFWGWMDATSITPMYINVVRNVLGSTMKDADLLNVRTDDEWTRAVHKGLIRLTEITSQGNARGIPVYTALGRVYMLSSPEQMVWRDAPSTHSYVWPIAHDVRPAAQALGAGGCTDCHAEDSPLDFGVALTPITQFDTTPPYQTMIARRGDDERLARAWAKSFAWRSIFKVLAFAGIGVVILIVLAFGLKCIQYSLGGARSFE